MKFETTLGLREIVVITGINESITPRAMYPGAPSDKLGRVVAIAIETDMVRYQVEYEDHARRDILKWFSADQLQGDPDFNQETGAYPESLE